ncbi:hypothetical protein BBD42_21625 [Paenibacillus sp. BIHB 4019]|uniref:Restriction endonuclease type IV Mrr domain-containing protein n=2 Tax=Paenibacillus sp. BIHB 4019 TaxID=1870819 RepID=A0A1B2DM42_9BACL|nr:hypothetical protein BBD42_21625 [Paenibacillus sp. BIHB 4019]
MRYYRAKKAIVIAFAKFTEPCETLAGIKHVKLLDRSDLVAKIDDFKRDDIQGVRDRTETESRIIFESWNETNSEMIIQ